MLSTVQCISEILIHFSRKRVNHTGVVLEAGRQMLKKNSKFPNHISRANYAYAMYPA